MRYSKLIVSVALAVSAVIGIGAASAVADIDANATVAPPDACTDRLRTGPVLIMALGDEPG